MTHESPARDAVEATQEGVALRKILALVNDDGGFPRFSARIGRAFDDAISEARKMMKRK